MLSVLDVLSVLRKAELDVDNKLRSRAQSVIQAANRPYSRDEIEGAIKQFVAVAQREPRVALTDFIVDYSPALAVSHVERYLANIDQAATIAMRMASKIAKQHDIDSPQSPVRSMSLEEIARLRKALRECGLKGWQVRQLLGIGLENYRKIETIQLQEDSEQTGVDSNYRPWSQGKELFNALCMDLFVNSEACCCRPPMILETCQGIGDATHIYRKHGIVVAFDKDKECFDKAQARFAEGGCLRRLEDSDFMEDLCRVGISQPDGGYVVVMPSRETDAIEAVSRLERTGWRFDAIDIDPFGSSMRLMDKALAVAQDLILLQVSVGDMYQGGKVTGYKEAFADLALEFPVSGGDSEKEYWRKRLWRAIGARFVLIAQAKSFVLVPFCVYVASQPNERILYEGQKISICGVDRIYFLGRRFKERDVDPPIYADLVRDPIMKAELLGAYLDGKSLDSPELPVFLFLRDLWPVHDQCLVSDNALPDEIRVRIRSAMEWCIALLNSQS